MRQPQVPGRVAADRMARQKDAVGVDRKPPAGVAQADQHGGMLAGREFVLLLSFFQPIDRDDDVAQPRGLAQPQCPCRSASPAHQSICCSAVVPAPLSVTIVG